MRFRPLPLVIAMSVLLAASAAAQQPGNASSDRPFAPVAASGLQWSPLQPAGWAAGMEIAVVRGDPSVADQPYVVRLRFRDGYEFPPHYHPVAENVTVLSGTFRLAMGERTDRSQLQTYRPGDFLFIDARHPHFGGAQGETVIQLHGVGPFQLITVGSPEDRR